jgi:hypothetical protein
LPNWLGADNGDNDDEEFDDEQGSALMQFTATYGHDGTTTLVMAGAAFSFGQNVPIYRSIARCDDLRWKNDFGSI